MGVVAALSAACRRLPCRRRRYSGCTYGAGGRAEYGTEGKNDQKKVQIDDCGAGMPCKIPYGTEFNLVNSLME